MARLRRLMEIHYEQVFSDTLPYALGASWWVPGIVTQPEWTPPTDVYETASECVVTLEIAGLREDGYEIVLYPEHVVVQGERPWRHLGEAARIHRAEIRNGRFHAAVRLPCRPGTIDLDGIRVRYEEGFLRIHLPKAVESRR